MTDEIVIVAARAFLASMRRDFIKKYPNEECLVRNLEEFSPGDQVRLRRGIQAALLAARPENLERLNNNDYPI